MKHLVLIGLVALAGACSKTAAPPPTRIAIDVTEAGFTPDRVQVPQGKPVTLVFRRTTDKTCATSVVLELGGAKLAKDLPLDQPVEIAATFPKGGELTYACGMDMLHGTIVVR